MSTEEPPVVYRGRYALQQSIGRGGMAEVFLAQDQLLDRPVAIKRLNKDLSADPSFAERFRREAQAAAKATHPNIVAVYDYFEEEDAYFIVQEYVDGRSLAELLRAEGRLHPDRAADICADVAAGLGAAHREGMVHRDIKPGNVLVAKDGQVKVADFGIARILAGQTDSELTQAGTVMGTATYFSPEQAQGKPVDPRSDLYSLGAVLFEMLIGRPPFEGDTPVAIAYKHVHEQPPRLREIDPQLPREIEAIDLKLLNKNPANRYPSADDLRADLRRFREGHKLSAEPVMPTAAAMGPVVPPPGQNIDFGSYEEGRYVEPPRRTGWFLLLTLIVMAGVGVGLYLLAQKLEQDDPNVVVAVPDVSELTQQQATRRLHHVGLDVEVREEASATVEAGIVFDQNPAAATEVREGTTVRITVSSGAETAEVPNVVGQDFITASSTLQDAGFVVQQEQAESPDENQFSEGQVFEQNPPAGTQAPAGSTVIIRIVQAPPPTTVAPTIVTSPPATAPPATLAPPTTV